MDHAFCWLTVGFYRVLLAILHPTGRTHGPGSASMSAVSPGPIRYPDGEHHISVPPGWSPEQAWEALVRGDYLERSARCRVAVVLVRDDVFVRLVRQEPWEGTWQPRGPRAGGAFGVDEDGDVTGRLK